MMVLDRHAVDTLSLKRKRKQLIKFKGMGQRKYVIKLKKIVFGWDSKRRIPTKNFPYSCILEYPLDPPLNFFI